MLLPEAFSRLEFVRHQAGSEAISLAIPVFQPGSIGGVPFVEVVTLQKGIDWNKNQLFLEPAQPLTKLSPEDVAAIQSSVKKGQSWHTLKILKSATEENAALKFEVARLKAELSALKST